MLARMAAHAFPEEAASVHYRARKGVAQFRRISIYMKHTVDL